MVVVRGGKVVFKALARSSGRCHNLGCSSSTKLHLCWCPLRSVLQFEVVTHLHLLDYHQLLPTSHHLVVMLPGPGTRSLAGWGPVRSSFVSVVFSCYTLFEIDIT